MTGYEILKKICDNRSYLHTLQTLDPSALQTIEQELHYRDYDLYQSFRSLHNITLPLAEYLRFLKNCRFHSSRPNQYFLYHRYRVSLIPTDIKLCEKAGEDREAISGIVIPAGVTQIEWKAFSCCSKLVYAAIPTGVAKIGSHAFEKCEFLPEITMPDSVTELGEGAYEGCKRLYRVNLGRSVRSIPASAFAGCKSLDEIVLPDGVTKIGSHAFAGCKRLQKVVIPKSVTKIAETAFLDCFTHGQQTWHHWCYYNKEYRSMHQVELTIHCVKGSYADTYAKAHGIKVKYI